jgi:radical SAM superfamily enzyme YgiQ (UPF0313 family)
MKKVKILLYFPNFNLYNVSKLLSHQPSLALGYLAASLTRKEIEYDVLDATAEQLDHEKIVDRIKRINPEYIGFTSNISMKYAIFMQSRLIRKYFPDIKIIIGGPWAVAEYRYLLEHKYADCIVFGEGEHTLIDLMALNPWAVDSLKTINGIAFLDGDTVQKNQERPPIENLNEIGYPNWNKFPKGVYDTLHREFPYYPIMTSRGCPFDCLNCTKLIHGYKIRTRSTESIIDELIYLKKHLNCKEILLMDDIFNANLYRAKNILRAIARMRNEFSFKIQLMNGIRGDMVDDEFCKLLSAAGVYKTGLGVESGSPGAIKFLKKQLNLQKLPDSIKLLHKYNIKVFGFFILGLPVENPNSFIHTVNFAEKIGVDVPYFFNLILFPGTKIYDYVKSKGYMKSSGFSDTDAWNFHATPIKFETPKFSQKDIDKARKYSIIRFYFNPYRFLHFLQSLSFSELKYFIRRFYSLIIEILFRLFTKPTK